MKLNEAKYGASLIPYALWDLARGLEDGPYAVDKSQMGLLLVDVIESSSKTSTYRGPKGLAKATSSTFKVFESLAAETGIFPLVLTGDGGIWGGFCSSERDIEGVTYDLIRTARLALPLINADPRWQFRMGISITTEEELAIRIITQNLAYLCYGEAIKTVTAAQARATNLTVGVAETIVRNSRFQEFLQPTPQGAILRQDIPDFHSSVIHNIHADPPDSLVSRVRTYTPKAEIIESDPESIRACAVFYESKHAQTSRASAPLDENAVAQVAAYFKDTATAAGGTSKLNPTDGGGLKAIQFLGLDSAPDSHRAVELAQEGLDFLNQCGIPATAGVGLGPGHKERIGSWLLYENAFLSHIANEAARQAHIADRPGTINLDTTTYESLVRVHAVLATPIIGAIASKKWRREIYKLTELYNKAIGREIATGQEETIAKIKTILGLPHGGLIEVKIDDGSGGWAIPLFAAREVVEDRAQTQGTEIISTTLSALGTEMRYFAAQQIFGKGQLEYDLEKNVRDNNPLLIGEIAQAIRNRNTNTIVIVRESQWVDKDSAKLFQALAADETLPITIVLIRNKGEQGRHETKANHHFNVSCLKTAAEISNFVNTYLNAQGITNSINEQLNLWAQTIISKHHLVAQEAIYEACTMAIMKTDPKKDLSGWLSNLQAIDIQRVGQARLDSLRIRAQRSLVKIIAALAFGTSNTVPLEEAVDSLRYLATAGDLYKGIKLWGTDLDQLARRGFIHVDQEEATRVVRLPAELAESGFEALSEEEKITIWQTAIDRTKGEDSANKKTLLYLMSISTRAQAIVSTKEFVLEKTAEENWKITPAEATQAYASAAEVVSVATKENEFAVAAAHYEYLIHIRSDYDSLLPSEIVAKNTLADLYFEQGQAYHNAGMVTEAVAAINQSLRISEQAHGPDNQQRSIGALVGRGTDINAMVMVAKGKEFEQERLLALSRLAPIVTHLQKKLFHKEPIKLTVRNFGNYERLWTLMSNLRGFNLKTNIPASKLEEINTDSERVNTVIRRGLRKPKVYIEEFDREEFHNELGTEYQNIANFYWHLAKECSQAGPKKQALKKARRAMREGFKLSRPETRSHAWLTYMHGLLYSIEGNHERAEELFNMALQEFSALKNISDIIDVIKEGAEEDPPLAVKVDNPYIQEAMNRITAAA